MSPFVLLLAGTVVVLGSILVLRLEAFFALLLGAFVVAALTDPAALAGYAASKGMTAAETQRLLAASPVQRITQGFGSVVGQIGIVIAMASVIGACMLETGAADRIVRGTLSVLGERRAAGALAISAFVLSIPVFFDTVFFLMVPLAKSLHLRTGRDYLLYVLAILAGGSMAHSLVPPTPGPLYVATELGVPLSTMIAGGCVVGGLACAAGLLFARRVNGVLDIPMRETPEGVEKLAALSRRATSELPSPGVALLPVALPLLLVAAGAAARAAGWVPAPGLHGPDAAARRLVAELAEVNLALTLGAAAGLLLLVRRVPGDEARPAVRGALSSAGVILLIVGAGGAFGQVLQQTGIAAALQRSSHGAQLAILPLAFLVTLLVRTAQGSATVAMITAAAAFKGFASPQLLGFHPVYLALAIGCGSKPIMWMNDSGFWIVTQMSRMTPSEGLRTLTPMLAVMGTVGLVATFLGALLLPLL